MDNNIVVKVLNIKTGIKIIEDVKYIRILSEKYNLLIMRNYLPVMGEIIGNVEIEGKETVKYEKIKGYYINKNNEFSLIIKGDI